MKPRDFYNMPLTTFCTFMKIIASSGESPPPPAHRHSEWPLTVKSCRKPHNLSMIGDAPDILSSMGRKLSAFYESIWMASIRVACYWRNEDGQQELGSQCDLYTQHQPRYLWPIFSNTL